MKGKGQVLTYRRLPQRFLTHSSSLGELRLRKMYPPSESQDRWWDGRILFILVLRSLIKVCTFPAVSMAICLTCDTRETMAGRETIWSRVSNMTNSHSLTILYSLGAMMSNWKVVIWRPWIKMPPTEGLGTPRRMRSFSMVRISFPILTRSDSKHGEKPGRLNSPTTTEIQELGALIFAAKSAYCPCPSTGPSPWPSSCPCCPSCSSCSNGHWPTQCARVAHRQR